MSSSDSSLKIKASVNNESYDSFPVLPGWYRVVFLYLEPLSTISPALTSWGFPGLAWFYYQLIPDQGANHGSKLSFPDDYSAMATAQLVNCYMLLSLTSTFTLRAIRDGLPNNYAAQERIIGAMLSALAVADFAHVIITLVWLPENIRWSPSTWNALTHGNLTVTILVFISRLAWFAGVGRTRHYYGRKHDKVL